jgi:hypothetical protein
MTSSHHKKFTVTLIGLVALLVTGCDVVSPDLQGSYKAAPVTSSVAYACPTLDEICDEAGPIIFSTLCPPDTTYKNEGEYNSCVSVALTHFVDEKGYTSCLNAGDFKTVKICVEEWIEEEVRKLEDDPFAGPDVETEERTAGMRKLRFHDQD